jgi:hypothetical protein
MLSILTLIFLQLVRFVPFVSGACPAAIPSWTISKLSVTFGEEVSIGGTMSFDLTNSVTNTTDALKCSLRANSRCEIAGTPTDKNIHIYIQTMVGTMYVTINQTCTGTP